MALRTAWLLLAVSAVALLCLQLRSFGLLPSCKTLFLLGGRGLLLLTLLTLAASVTAPRLASQAPSATCRTVTEDENRRRQRRMREQQQEAVSTKSSAYLENVLKPRQEMRRRQQEERFYRMTGQTWRLLGGCTLGGQEEPRLASEDATPCEAPSREAARRWKLPERPSPCTASRQQPKARKVLALPEEPPATAEDVVTVALRCHDGRVFRRRFYKSWSSQVLLDWMMKVGYDRSIYTLSTCYPRRPLEVVEGQTLEDSGLISNTILHVEQKNACPSL